jgi:hypothetical protein
MGKTRGAEERFLGPFAFHGRLPALHAGGVSRRAATSPARRDVFAVVLSVCILFALVTQPR